jgi:hypothetical protein
MIQLSYQAAFDPFHAMYRGLRILAATETTGSLLVDHARILDFYLLFPFRISEIRLTQQHRRFRRLAVAYQNSRPYGDQPDDAQLLYRMKPMQIAALETLAEKKIIDVQKWRSGSIVRTNESLPPALAVRVGEANATESDLMEAISALGSEYQLLGQNGLKDRTGLLEYRYDAV